MYLASSSDAISIVNANGVLALQAKIHGVDAVVVSAENRQEVPIVNLALVDYDVVTQGALYDLAIQIVQQSSQPCIAGLGAVPIVVWECIAVFVACDSVFLFSVLVSCLCTAFCVLFIIPIQDGIVSARLDISKSGS